MAFTEQEENILRTRSVLIDNGDGLGTFTGEELALLKEILAQIKKAESARLAQLTDTLGITAGALQAGCPGALAGHMQDYSDLGGYECVPGCLACWEGSIETEAPARWIPPCTAAPTPDWQPADITAESLVAKPGQGAKL